MSSSTAEKYILIFDTNILYEGTNNGCNFCEFKFNKQFYNVIDEIEKRELVEFVGIGIPEVVWNELSYRRIEAYSDKKKELDKIVKQYQFPNLQYELTEVRYDSFLIDRLKFYRSKLSNYQIEIIHINLPSSSRFDSIINRAFLKNPPFEGEDKRSDKGFKDALIWESIIEYKTMNIHHKIAFYTRDNQFKQFLIDEYEKTFSEDIEFLNNECAVIHYLAEIQKNIFGLRRLKRDSIDHYRFIKYNLDFNIIRKIIYGIELHYKIGIIVYDISNVDVVKITNVIESTEDDDLDKLTFQAFIKCNLTFSNVEEQKDIDMKDEEVIANIDFVFGDDNYNITKLQVLSGNYSIEKTNIEGDLNV